MQITQDFLTGRGSKLGIGATKKLPGEGSKRPRPRLIKMQLRFEGQIVPYEGVGALQNYVLLKFIRDTYKRMFVTAELDMEGALEKASNSLGLTKNKDYAWAGINAAGKKNIEGLLPDSVVSAVNAANTGLVQAAAHGTNDEQKSAKSNLKKLYLAEFKAKAKPSEEFYKGFYPLVKAANKALTR